MVEEIDQGGGEVRQGERRRVVGSRELHPHSRACLVAAHSGRRIRAHLQQRDDRRRGVSLDAGRGRRSARRRHVVAHPVAPARRVEVRRDLRRRAEEHRPRGSHHRHRAQGPTRPRAADHADGVSLEGAGGGRLDGEHAAHLRDLHRGPRVRVAARAGRAGRRRAEEHGEGRAALRLPRPVALLHESRAQGRPLAHERAVQAARRRAGRAVPQGGEGAGHGAAQGTPFRRRHARVDLQRDADRGRAGAGGVDEGIREAQG